MEVTNYTSKNRPNVENMRKKELVRAYHVINLYGERNNAHNRIELIDCRLYMGRSSSSSVIYCAIWITTEPHWIIGKGNAGGYGYHKLSAAVGYALNNAGFEFDEGIDGRGDSAIRDALYAVCEHLGYDKKRLYIVESYA